MKKLLAKLSFKSPSVASTVQQDQEPSKEDQTPLPEQLADPSADAPSDAPTGLQGLPEELLEEILRRVGPKRALQPAALTCRQLLQVCCNIVRHRQSRYVYLLKKLDKKTNPPPPRQEVDSNRGTAKPEASWWSLPLYRSRLKEEEPDKIERIAEHSISIDREATLGRLMVKINRAVVASARYHQELSPSDLKPYDISVVGQWKGDTWLEVCMHISD